MRTPNAIFTALKLVTLIQETMMQEITMQETMLRYSASIRSLPIYSFTRRLAILVSAGSLLALAACSDDSAKSPTSNAGSGTAQAAPAAKPDMAKLLEAGPLGDKILGKADAPVTIVEYASLTCSHCADFHANTFKTLKEKYIETGKVRMIFREFPLDPLSTAASMMARCAPETRYFPLVDVLFSQQKNWAMSEKPLDSLLAIARQAGFTQESFEACLKNQSIYDGLNEAKKRGVEGHGVNSTPTFFINGEIRRGNMSVEDLEKLLAPHLPKQG